MLKIKVDKNSSEIEATEKGKRLITESVYAAVGLADVISSVTGLSKEDSADFLAFSVKSIVKTNKQKYHHDVMVTIPDEVLNKILDDKRGAGDDA